GAPMDSQGGCKRLRIALGTLIAIDAVAETEAIAKSAVDAAFAAIVAVDRRMNPQSATSDLHRVSCAALNEPRAIHASTWELMKRGARLHWLTDGLFDPCLPTRAGRFSDIDIGKDPEVVCRAPVELDFGGFAKGYAVDRAIETLIARKCTAGLVNAGGDL